MRKTPGSEEIPVNIVGSSTFGRYNKISPEKTYNMFISDQWLVNFAGYKRVINLLPGGAGEGRGIFKSVRGNIVIVVVNSAVYSINTAFVATFIGNLVTLAGEVFIDENLNSQICIVDGTNAYIYNYTLPPNLTIQALAGTLIPNYVTYHNTFFLFGNAATTNNGSLWFAYQFATPTTIVIATPGSFAIQTKPDFALAVVRIPGQSTNVLAMGGSVSEIWANVGGLQNYRKNSSRSIDYGVISVSTIATSDEYIAWLAVNENNSPTIMVFSLGGAKPISTDGIDYLLGTIIFPAQSTAMFYRQDGHLFYQLTFFNPRDNLTIAYDFTTEKFFHLSDFELNYHPARDFVYFDQNTYFLALNNAALYLSNTDVTTYNENLDGEDDPNLVHTIQRIRIVDNIKFENSRKYIINSFVMTIEQGYDTNVTGLSLYQDNLITEDAFKFPDDLIITEFGVQIIDEDSFAGVPGADQPPYQQRVDLSISSDGANTWSSTVSRGLNPIGLRKNILSWENLGQANDFSMKFRFWGTSRFVVNNGIIEVY